MTTSILGQALTFDVAVTLAIAVIAGVAIAVLISVLPGRYLFPIQHDN